MSARYFLPEHAKLTDVYSKAELRTMLQAGQLSRSDMVTDDETGKAYLLGDLLAVPFLGAPVLPSRSTTSLQTTGPRSHEFRADTPLPRTEHEDEQDEGGEEMIEEEEEIGDEEQKQDDEGAVALERDIRSEKVTGEDEDKEQENDDDEELLFIGHPSWLAFPKSLFIMAVCVGSAVFFFRHNVRLEWITLLGSIAGLILLFIWLDRTTTTYFVTTRRVEVEFGIIGRNTKEVRIRDIRAIDVVQQGFDAVVGLGTVKFDSSASAGPEVTFRHVRRPHDLKQLVRDLQG